MVPQQLKFVTICFLACAIAQNILCARITVSYEDLLVLPRRNRTFRRRFVAVRAPIPEKANSKAYSGIILHIRSWTRDKLLTVHASWKERFVMRSILSTLVLLKKVLNGRIINEHSRIEHFVSIVIRCFCDKGYSPILKSQSIDNCLTVKFQKPDNLSQLWEFSCLGLRTC